MRGCWWFGWASLVLALASGCGGESTDTPLEPIVHRAFAQACDDFRPATQEPIYFVGECAADADCTNGPNGRCEPYHLSPLCSYDECFADADCGAGSACHCGAGDAANSCVTASCGTDADCGDGGFCSPSFGARGSSGGVVGYFCHSANDLCVDDESCRVADSAAYCAYSAQTRRWACQVSDVIED